MKNIEFTRIELYQLVWSRSLTSFAEEFGVTFHDLKRICVQSKIPLPKSGHWTRIRHGQEIPSPPLPKTYKGDEIISIIQHERVLSPLDILTNKIQEIQGLSLKVPSKLSKPHRLIIEAKKRLFQSGRHVYDGHISLGREVIDIKVSPASASRALRLMDTIIKLLIGRGHDVIKYQWETYAVIFGEKIQIRLFESRKTIPKKDFWDRTYSPTGNFRLEYKSYWQRNEFHDGRLKLEEQLARILAKFELIAKQEIEDRIRREKERKIREEKDRIEREILERRKVELKSFKKIARKAHRWHIANTLRNYIRLIEQNATDNKSLNKELVEWISWANEKINWYDPVIEKEDQLLKNEDRKEIDNIFHQETTTDRSWPLYY